ncbi:hypothetical protein HJFPF1_10663 [Paramyrothecium foliicola]|nr:hypothetical protein HJFPF1_10663 [Paramyrothecium foliicola]
MAHYSNLDEETIEWRILLRVLPVFSMNLDWECHPKATDFQRKPAGKDVGPERVNDSRDLEIFKIVFATKISALPRLRPRITLSRSEMIACLEQLRILLNRLEGFVNDDVVSVAKAGAVLGMKWVLDVPGRSRIMDSTIKFIATIQTEVQKYLGWLTVTNGSAGPDQPYPKLEALARLLEQGQDAARHVKLNQSIDDLQDVRRTIDTVQKIFRGFQLKGFLDVTEIAESKWNQTKSRHVSSILYDLIHKGTSGCAGHRAKLRLDESLLDNTNDLVEREVLISPCPMDSSSRLGNWRHGRFTLKKSSIVSDFSVPEEPDPILDLCKYLSQEVMSSSTDCEAWNISFGDGVLHRCKPPRSTSAIRNLHAPTIALSILLTKNIFSHAGLSLNPHKAALALSLGQSLLHLFHSGWTRDEWTPDTINFLYDKTADQERIVDIRHPYIACVLSENEFENRADSETRLETSYTSTNSEPTHVLWSFAMLLLSIQTGKVINVNQYETTDGLRDAIWKEIRFLETGDRRIPELQLYTQAIHGCVALTDQLTRDEPKIITTPSTGPSPNLYRMFYANVVQYLDVYYDRVSKNKNDDDYGIPLSTLGVAQKSLQVERRDHSPAPAPLVQCSFSSQPTSSAELSKSVYKTPIGKTFKHL